MKSNPHKAGQVGAIMVGGAHVVWSALMFLGWAQPLADFSMRMHMVHSNIVFGPFDASSAAILIIIAAAVGYGVGYIFARVWNKVHHG